jgi:hypothetical protein
MCRKDEALSGSHSPFYVEIFFCSFGGGVQGNFKIGMSGGGCPKMTILSEEDWQLWEKYLE